MFRNRRKLFLIAILSVSVLSPFVFFSSGMKPWKGSTIVTIWQDIYYPVEYSWHASSNFVKDVWNHYFDLSNASKENDRLKSDLAFQKTRIMNYEEQILEVARLRKLLGFAEKFEGKLLAAEVVGIPTSTPFQSIRVTRGKLDEVEVGMPVVTAEGIVGRVIRTGLKFSDVQLLSDPNFNLDVLVQRTRVRGILSGDSNSNCILHLNRRAEIRIGDTLITSGIVGGFSKGLAVGHVKRISYASDNISQAITVEPWVDYRRIEEVFIMKRTDPELQKIVETAGYGWLESVGKNKSGGG